MTKIEYAKLENVMYEAIKAAERANNSFSKANKISLYRASDSTRMNELISSGQNDIGYAQGINQALVSVGFKHKDMKKLGELI